MNGKRVAVIVSQPAHLLTVAGMLLRWQPHVLILNRADEDTSRLALTPLGLTDRLTSFGISETESFDRVLAGDFAFHAAIGDRIFAWLHTVLPDVVLGNAYEAFRFHNDVARLLIDDSIQRGRNLGRRIENYEFPLACHLDQPSAAVQSGVFPVGVSRELRLNPRELTTKRKLIAKIGVAPLLAHPEVEPYRDVPFDRDYTSPPPGLALHYDERGREGVSAGRYAEAVTFRNHFVPLVRALGLGPAVRTAA